MKRFLQNTLNLPTLANCLFLNLPTLITKYTEFSYSNCVFSKYVASLYPSTTLVIFFSSGYAATAITIEALSSLARTFHRSFAAADILAAVLRCHLILMVMITSALF